MHGRRSVDVAEKWGEGYLSHHGKSHGHAETEYEAWSKQGSLSICLQRILYHDQFHNIFFINYSD